MSRTDLSVVDIFKIGIGPSSSHTMGPWKAALNFVSRLHLQKKLVSLVAIRIELLGSLCKTGKGHGTDRGILMGLLGELPDQIDPQTVSDKFNKIIFTNSIVLSTRQNPSSTDEPGELVTKSITFQLAKDLVYCMDLKNSSYLYKLTGGKLLHPNTLCLVARFEDGSEWVAGYHSIGGGFIEKLEDCIAQDNEDDNINRKTHIQVGQNRGFPYPIATPEDLLRYIKSTGYSIDEIVSRNEYAWMSKEELDNELKKIMYVMIASVYHGCHTSGVLAGGLKVNRRAAGVYEELLIGLPKEIMVKRKPYKKDPNFDDLNEWVCFIAGIYSNDTPDFKRVSRWVIAFALAVNEENAAYGRIVTSPTNGAAGVIPAVILYHLCFSCREVNFGEVKKFLLCASEIGSLFKKGSTISAAAGGCQAEIGVSSAMAAAGLALVGGGSSQQVLSAAEIAMEHHLGLTCDPVKGLVQVPCIERNSMGAMKAITATELALMSDPDKSVVQLQDIIKTMWNTAQDMSSKYKETSEGGLATTVGVNFSEC